MASPRRNDHVVRAAGGVVAGVAVGLLTAAASVYSSEVLNPFPVSYTRSSRTVNIAFRNRVTGRITPLDQPSFDLLASSQTEFEALGAALPLDLKQASNRDVIPAEFVNADFFRVLDVKLSMGRLPVPPTGGGLPEVLASRRFVRDHLGGVVSALGHVVGFSACQLVIVGVASDDLVRWRRRAELWGRIEDLRACASEDILGAGYFATSAAGVLRAGTDAAQVQAVLEARLANSLRARGDADVELSVQRAAAGVHSPATQAGLAVFLLGALAACAAAVVSVVSLQSSAIERQRAAWVVRRTLGAPRRALAGLVAKHNIGALLAGLLAVAATHRVAARQLAALGLSLPGSGWSAVALVAVVAVIGVAGVTGLARLLRFPLAECVRGLQTSGGFLRGHLLLLGGQVASASLIAALAVLCWTSVRRLETVDTGSRIQDVETIALNWDTALPENAGSAAALMADLETRLGERLDRPVGIGTDVPFTGMHNRTSMWFPDGTRRLSAQSADVPGIHAVSPGYLTALGVRLLEGRHFMAADGQASEPAAIVSEATVRAYWPGRSALGQTFKLRPSGRWIRVVGVVSDLRYASVDEPARPEVYVTYDELPWRRAVLVLGPPPSRGRPKEADLLRVVSSVAGTLPGGVLSGRRILDSQYGLARLLAGTAALVAAGMLCVCAAATLAIAAHLVSQRRAEIGLRLALGATSSRVARDVLARPLVTASVGSGIGVVLSVPLGLWLRATLYGVAPLDVTLTGLAGAAVCGLAWLGGLWATLPDVREVDPATLLRAV